MKSFLYVSFVSVFFSLFVACSAPFISGCGESEKAMMSRGDIPPLISPEDSLQVFDIEINFVGKNINGMMLVKKLCNDTVRVLVNSYFGMSLMDFEVSVSGFEAHYMFEPMNRPAIKKLFGNDLKILLGLNLPANFWAEKSICLHQENRITIKTKAETIYYKLSASNRSILGIKTSGLLLKNDSFSQKITFNHSGFFTPKITIRKNQIR